MAAHRDPGGFARLKAGADPAAWSSRLGCRSRTQVAILLIAKGGGVSDITVGDCLELREAEFRTCAQQGRGRSLFYAWLHQAGTFPPGAPVTLRFVSRMSGQVSVDRLVDRYELACRPVRDLIVDYLAERQPALDYNSLEQASRNLALHFWKNLEACHPGIGSLHLPAGAAAAWKERVRVKVDRPPAAGRHPGRGHQPPDQRDRAAVGGPRVLPRHRPVGDRGPGPLGAVGRALPGHRGRRVPSQQVRHPAQGPHGPADPRAPAGAARAGQSR